MQKKIIREDMGTIYANANTYNNKMYATNEGNTQQQQPKMLHFKGVGIIVNVRFIWK